MILTCSCKHAQQDARHGEGRRVHNQVKAPADQAKQYRCTICGNVRGASQ